MVTSLSLPAAPHSKPAPKVPHFLHRDTTTHFPIPSTVSASTQVVDIVAERCSTCEMTMLVRLPRAFTDKESTVFSSDRRDRPSLRHGVLQSAHDPTLIRRLASPTAMEARPRMHMPLPPHPYIRVGYQPTEPREPTPSPRCTTPIPPISICKITNPAFRRPCADTRLGRYLHTCRSHLRYAILSVQRFEHAMLSGLRQT